MKPEVGMSKRGKKYGGVKPRGEAHLLTDPKGPTTVEVKNPEAVAAAVDRLSDPLSEDRLRELAESCGLSQVTMQSLLRRHRARSQPVVEELKRVRTDELQALLDDRATRALGWLDDAAMSQASARDLAIVVGILLEKRQLLRGEPTQILTVDDRRTLNEIAASVMKECHRRGMVIEGAFTEVPEGGEAQSGARMTSREPRAGGRGYVGDV
jgi:hypothetical protein